VVHPYCPKKRQAGCKIVNIHAGIYPCAQILQPICQRISQLNIASSAGFLHVVSRNRNRVKFRHIFSGKLKNIGNNFHGGEWRIDVGIPHHKLFQDIVLDSAGQFFHRHALLFGG
jgi:hypothetical protein